MNSREVSQARFTVYSETLSVRELEIYLAEKLKELKIESITVEHMILHRENNGDDKKDDSTPRERARAARD